MERETGYCIKCMMPLGADDVCPYCGYANNDSATYPAHILPPGSVLKERYLIGTVLGQGGFGITYIGRDLVLGLRVAVKEYYPTGYVNRNNKVTFELTYDDKKQKEFVEKGKVRFLQEAKVLAQFHGNQGIVDIRDFFEENGTAYIIMDYLEGEDLRVILKKKQFTPDEIFDLMNPVFRTLEQVHNAGVVHRDISPDNIMMLKDGTLKLMDFGAARLANYTDQRSVSVVLKTGYAPEEQYRPKGKQGPWTDIYALCATIYKCITGITPDDALERLINDQIKWPSDMGIPISITKEQILKKGMAVLARDRFQSLEELMNALEEKSGTENISGAEIGSVKKENKTSPDLKPQAVSDGTTVYDASDDSTVYDAYENEKTVYDQSTVLDNEEVVTVIDEQPEEGKGKTRKHMIRWAGIAGVILLAIVLIYGIGSPKKKNNDNTEGVIETVETGEEELRPRYTNELGVGWIVEYGTYEQNNNELSGPEPIEWIVLEANEDDVLLLSRYALDCQMFSDTGSGTWSESSLRKWLNGTFFESAFDDAEAAFILETYTGEGTNDNNGTASEEDLMDKVYLLSSSEAESYPPTNANIKVEFKCELTSYAAAQGKLPKNNGNYCSWWLRTSGDDPSLAAQVTDNGVVDFQGGEVSSYSGVRPVIRIRVSNPKAEGISDPDDQSSDEISSGSGTDSEETSSASVVGTVGSTVEFGSYEQDNDLSNGSEKLEWVVLDVKDGKELLLCKYGIDNEPYNRRSEAITWENCTLREWLNSYFYETAFNESEQGLICETLVTADENRYYSADSGEDTTDKVFLLSAVEAESYFASDRERLCVATPYAYGKGAYEAGDGNCMWWLRTAGEDPSTTSGVHFGGSVNTYGYDVSTYDFTVRPAVWITIPESEEQADASQLPIRERIYSDSWKTLPVTTSGDGLQVLSCRYLGGPDIERIDFNDYSESEEYCEFVAHFKDNKEVVDLIGVAYFGGPISSEDIEMYWPFGEKYIRESVRSSSPRNTLHITYGPIYAKDMTKSDPSDNVLWFGVNAEGEIISVIVVEVGLPQ